MTNLYDGAKFDGAAVRRPNDARGCGNRALARLIERPHQPAHHAEFALGAMARPRRARMLGDRYGASWRDSPDILFALRLTPKGAVFEAINPACEQSLGLSGADVAGRSPMAVLPRPSGCALLSACLECAAGRRTTRFTHPMTIWDRDRRWDTTLTPICGEDGGVFLILGRSREVAPGQARPDPSARLAGGQGGAGATGQAKARAFSLERDWRIVSCSPEAASRMGVEVDQYPGRDAREELLVSGAMLSAVEIALTLGHPSKVLMRSQSRSGRWVEFEVEPAAGGVEVFFRDVSLEAGGGASAGSPDAAELGRGGDSVEMALLDRDGVIISVNSAWRETFAPLQTGGTTFGVQTPYEEVCQRIVPDLDPSVLHKAIRELLAGEVRSLTHAYVVVSSGFPRWRQIRMSPLQAGVAHFIAIHEDLTELGQAQAALRRTSEQLHSAQQDERKRIAIELHGSAGEYLAELDMGVSRLRRLMSEKTGAQDILDEVAVSLKEAAREIRVMSNLMNPASLHRHGLETAARRFVDGFATRTGLKTVFRSEGAVDRASGPVQHAAFRVIQEALSNVYRHAHADGVEVELASRDAELTLRIADDGRGIGSLRQAYPEGVPPGVGIPGMRSRVEQLGGWMDVASDRAGTVVVARMPLARAASAAGGR